MWFARTIYICFFFYFYFFYSRDTCLSSSWTFSPELCFSFVSPLARLLLLSSPLLLLLLLLSRLWRFVSHKFHYWTMPGLPSDASHSLVDLRYVWSAAFLFLLTSWTRSSDYILKASHTNGTTWVYLYRTELESCNLHICIYFQLFWFQNFVC